MEKKKCDICQKMFSESELISGHGINHGIEKLIQKDFPAWDDYKHICKNDFHNYRTKYILSIIDEETGSVRELKDAVLQSIINNDTIAENVNQSIEQKMKIGDVISDKVATFGGSWKFIIFFFLVLILWIIINTLVLVQKPFDPYPFILMNLILSCIAAIQAPIIMMSQNRQERKDRLQSENDYKVNLKSEIEIRTLHEKVDHLLLDQWARMMKIQEMEIEMLEEIKEKIR
jgi:uncharacterized membrane protein